MDGRPRQLHLGLGAFHRAHPAAVLQRLHDAGDTRWRLAAGNLRDDGGATEAALVAQGGAYTLETVAPDGARRYQRITALGTVVPYEPGHAGLIRLGADPDTRIVSFTVTEAGYCLDADGRLDRASPGLLADVEAARTGAAATTVYGVLAAILAARRRAQAGPLTLLNCDNLRHNGERVRDGLRQFLALAGDEPLLEWMDANTRCPNAMVDRITPRPTDAVRLRVAETCGRDDPAALMAEDFLQWVVEDDFIADRPAWEDAGVRLTADVAPFEEAKIRILNAGHSVVAWAGALAGHDTVHAAIADPAIRRVVRDYLVGHVLPCLEPSPLDLAAYAATVLARFGNAALDDRIERVAADSHAKFPGFIAPTLRQRLRDGADLRDAAIVPALLLAFLQRWHRGALPFAYRDQAMDAALAHATCAAADPVADFCAQRALWGEAAGDPALVEAVRAAAARIEDGALAA
jgi:D-arabinitol 4-dehydrogenase